MEGPSKNFDEVRKNKVSGSRGIPATIVGGILLGIGMALCCACPGTVWVQLGSGVIPSSILILVGALVGAIVWTFVKKPIESTWFFTCGRLSDEKLNLDIWLGWPYWILALVFAVMLAVGVFLLEYFMPYTQELNFLFDVFPRNGNFFADVAWPPYVTGILVGILQLPALTLLTVTIGSSSGFTVFTSVFLYPLRHKNDFIKSRITERINFFQPIYLISAAVGGVIAGASSGSLHFNSGLSLGLSFAGGFILIFGAQLGGGCTSGHGLSGFQTLAVPSMFATAAMFAGGIGTAFILFFAGAYGDSLNSWPFNF